MNKELIISAYGSHNSSISMLYNGNYTVVEVERWLNKKNAGLINYLPAGYPKIVFDEITDFLLSKTDRSDVDLYLTNYNDLNKLKPSFNYKEHKRFDHHEAHAATAFYQSPFEEALTITFDGGGDLGFFNIYKTDRQNGVQLLERFNQDLGFAYMILADHLKDIKRDPLNIGNLVYAGKLMGLCSYGKIRNEWLAAFTEFYETFNYYGDSYLGGAEAAEEAVPKLMKEIGVENFTKNTRLEGQIAYDIAATTQYVFEQQFYKFIRPYFKKYKDMPVTLSGGCALNVILNAKILKDRNGKVFVPPNSNDCGIAVGGILLHKKPEHQVDLTYSGVPLLDSHIFSTYIENGNFSVIENVSTKELANYINLGNIVGIINGDSEHGPRALGNRSIICNPVGDMKDVLNEKVKNREWYRPFAPVVRLEDATTYFDVPEGFQSRHMTYVAEIKDKYKETIPAVTHEDGTGRIQTVTKQQNEFMYNLLTEFSEISDHAVLLNTSFNVNGKPILSRLSDALEILSKTELDAVYYDNKLIFRKGDEEKYERNIISENIKPLDNATTLYLIATPQNKNDINKKYISKMKKIVNSQQDNIVIVSQHVDEFKKVFGDDVEYHELHKGMLYYHEMMQEKIPNLKMSHHEFKDYVRLLWIKNIMYKNYYRTQNHMFVTIDNLLNDKNIENDIKLIINLAKEDEKIIVKGNKYNGIFTEKDMKKYSGEETIPNEAPTFDIIWGNFEQIEWLSVNYEGSLLSLMRQNIVCKDTDYGLLTFVKYPDRFKVC